MTAGPAVAFGLRTRAGVFIGSRKATRGEKGNRVGLFRCPCARERNVCKGGKRVIADQGVEGRWARARS